jgi:hypothetical protein
LVAALCADRPRVRFLPQEPQRGIYVRQIGPGVVELLLQAFDQPRQVAALIDEASEGISGRSHAAALCQ